MDQILSHADAQLLLSFRRTATGYSERCLQIIAHHLVVHGTPSSLIINSACGDLSFPLDRDWKHWRLGSNPWLGHCHILDIHCRRGIRASELLGPALKNIKILRILSGCGPHITYSLAGWTIPVVVMFGRLPEYDPATDMFYLWPGERVPAARRVVWTISAIASGLPLFLGSNVSPYSHQVENATIHFRFCQPTSNPDKMFSWLGQVVEDIVAYVISNTVTIVDLDQVRTCSVLQDDLIDGFEDRRLCLLDQLGEHAARVKFMTGNEYCDEYGDEQYRMETCEKL